LDRATLAAYVAWNFDLYWALDSADRALVLTLPLSAFGGGRGAWGMVRAELYWLSRDTGNSRHYADTARVGFDAYLRAIPRDVASHMARGLMLAYVGRREAALQEAERGRRLAQAEGDQYLDIPFTQHMLARIYAVIGDKTHAIEHLDSLLAKSYYISPAWMRIDPTWNTLHDDPRFERLIAQPVADAAPTR